MKKINRILELEDVVVYLNERGLLKQYLKAVSFILMGKTQLVYFRLRQPKSDGAWYFRINKKYRAIGYFHGDEFTVSDIDDHQ